MPQTVEIEGVGTIEFPDGTSIEEITAAVNRDFPAQKKQSSGYSSVSVPPMTLSDSLSRVARGGLTGGGGMINALGTIIDPYIQNPSGIPVGDSGHVMMGGIPLDVSQNPAYNVGPKLQKAAPKLPKITDAISNNLKESADFYTQFTDPERDGLFVSEALEGAGTMLPIIPLGPAAPAGASLMLFDEGYQEAKDLGGTEDEALQVGAIMATTGLVTEKALGVPKMLSRATKVAPGVGGSLAARLLKRVSNTGKKAAAGAVGEGAQEGLEQMSQNFGVGPAVTGLAPDRGLLENVPRSAALGAAVGGGMSGAFAGAGQIDQAREQNALFDLGKADSPLLDSLLRQGVPIDFGSTAQQGNTVSGDMGSMQKQFLDQALNRGLQDITNPELAKMSERMRQTNMEDPLTPADVLRSAAQIAQNQPLTPGSVQPRGQSVRKRASQQPAPVLGPDGRPLPPIAQGIPIVTPELNMPRTGLPTPDLTVRNPAPADATSQIADGQASFRRRAGEFPNTVPDDATLNFPDPPPPASLSERLASGPNPQQGAPKQGAPKQGAPKPLAGDGQAANVPRGTEPIELTENVTLAGPAIALKLKDGRVLFNPKWSAHFDGFGRLSEEDASNVVDGGFIVDGKFEPGGDLSRGLNEGESVSAYYDQPPPPPVSDAPAESLLSKFGFQIDSPLYEQTVGDLEVTESDSQASEDFSLRKLFGSEGAKRYRALHRKANSPIDTKGADRASDEILEMESGLSEAEQDLLFGVGGPDALDLATVREYLSKLKDLDGGSPAGLGWSLQWALTNIAGETATDPAQMSPKGQLAYAQMQEAMRIAEQNNFDLSEVSKAALKAAAERFSDPNDAAFVLDRFVNRRPSSDLTQLGPPQGPPKPAEGAEAKSPEEAIAESKEAIAKSKEAIAESKAKRESDDLSGETPKKKRKRAKRGHDEERRPDTLSEKVRAGVGKIKRALFIKDNPEFVVHPIVVKNNIDDINGQDADTALDAAIDMGLVLPTTTLTEFGEMLNNSAEAGKGDVKQAAREKRLIKGEEKQRNAFDKAQDDPALSDDYDLTDAEVGDEMTMKGEPVKVSKVEKDASGAVTSVTLDDGKVLGTQKVHVVQGKTVSADKDSIDSADPDWGVDDSNDLSLETESVQDQKTREATEQETAKKTADSKKLDDAAAKPLTGDPNKQESVDQGKLFEEDKDLFSQDEKSEETSKADAIRKLKIDTKGKTFDATIGLPIAVINGAIEAAALVVDAGGKAADALKAAVAWVKKHHKGKFNEAELRRRLRGGIAQRKSDRGLWDTAGPPIQKIESGDTSNVFVPSTNASVDFKPVKGGINADIGGGRWELFTQALRERGVTNLIFDPFNRSQKHNKETASKIRDHQADTATANNVLNVIAEEAAREGVIKQAANAIKPEGEAYFLIHQGSTSKDKDGNIIKKEGDGIGRKTTKGWQNYRKAKTYMDEVRKHFKNVRRRGKLIIADNKVGATESTTAEPTPPAEPKAPARESEADRLGITTLSMNPFMDPAMVKKIVDEALRLGAGSVAFAKRFGSGAASVGRDSFARVRRSAESVLDELGNLEFFHETRVSMDRIKSYWNQRTSGKNTRHVVRDLAQSSIDSNVTLVRRIGDRHNSPIIRKIADLLWPRVGSGNYSEDPFDHRILVEEGRLIAKAEKVLAPINKFLLAKTITKPDGAKRATNFDERNAFLSKIGDYIADGSLTPPAGLIADSVKGFQAIFKELLEYQREAGIEIGDVGKNYFKRVINVNVVIAKPRAFLKAAAKAYRATDPKLSQEEAMELAVQWQEAILLAEAGMAPDGNLIHQSQGTTGDEQKKRSFNKEADSILADFYQRNASDMIGQYIHSAVRRTEIMKMFGTKAEKGGKGKKPAKAKLWGKLGGWALQMEKDGVSAGDIELVMDAISNVTIGMRNASQTARMVAGALTTYGTLRHLAFSVLTSMVEPVAIAMRTGKVSDLYHAYNLSLQNWIKWTQKKGDNAAARQLALDIGIISEIAGQFVATTRYGSPETAGQTSRMLATGYLTGTGLLQFTESTRIATMMLSTTYIQRLASLKLDSGAPQKLVTEELNEMGIPADDQVAFAKWIANRKNTRVYSSDFVDSKNRMARLYRSALVRINNESIMNPNRAIKNILASKYPLFSVIYNLQSFAYAFWENSVKRNYNRVKRAIDSKGEYTPGERLELMMPAMMTPVMLAASSALIAARIMLAGAFDRDDEEKSTAKMLAEAASRSGQFGKFDPAVNMAVALKYQKSPDEVYNGPVLGQGSRLFSAVIKYFQEENREDTRTHERRLARETYNGVIRPLMAAGEGAIPRPMIPGPMGRAIDIVRSVVVFAAAHPEVRESLFVEPFGGEKPTPPDPTETGPKPLQPLSARE